jgi:hypothetical protein
MLFPAGRDGRRTVFNDEGTAEGSALSDAERDIARTIDCARCPKCRLRNPGAGLRFWKPYLIVVAVFVGIGLLLGFAPTLFDMQMTESGKDSCKWLVPLVLGVPMLFVVPLVSLPKWSTIDARVRWIEEP